MALGTFALVSRRWRPSSVVHSDYENYAQLGRFIPRELFEARMATVKQLVSKEFPHVWLDSHLFVLAIAIVIAAAVFAIIARALTIDMWYPLCILIIPAVIAYWTTRRRRLQFIKMSKFHDKLHDCLRKLTVLDVAYRIRWSYRRLKDVDTRESLGLRSALDSHAIILIIEVTQVEYGCSNSNGQQRRSDVLPTYESVQQDIVLDVGPPPSPAMEEISVSSPPPVYSSSEYRDNSSYTSAPTGSLPPPPSYCHQARSSSPFTPSTSSHDQASSSVSSSTHVGQVANIPT